MTPNMGTSMPGAPVGSATSVCCGDLTGRSQAKLKIVFYPEAEGKRAKTINVELRAPNGSNLKDQTRRHQIVSEKYLARWG
jgi:hypothetical protein